MVFLTNTGRSGQTVMIKNEFINKKFCTINCLRVYRYSLVACSLSPRKLLGSIFSNYCHRVTLSFCYIIVYIVYCTASGFCKSNNENDWDVP